MRVDFNHTSAGMRVDYKTPAERKLLERMIRATGHIILTKRIIDDTEDDFYLESETIKRDYKKKVDAMKGEK